MNQPLHPQLLGADGEPLPFFHVWLVMTEDPYLHHARGQQLARGHAILGPNIGS